MPEFQSPLTNAVARQYDLFQGSLETIDKDRKFLNYGYSVASYEPIEERQARLCLEVFRAAGIAAGHVVVDVGFGSGEQDFLLARDEGALLLQFPRDRARHRRDNSRYNDYCQEACI